MNLVRELSHSDIFGSDSIREMVLIKSIQHRDRLMLVKAITEMKGRGQSISMVKVNEHGQTINTFTLCLAAKYSNKPAFKILLDELADLKDPFGRGQRYDSQIRCLVRFVTEDLSLLHLYSAKLAYEAAKRSSIENAWPFAFLMIQCGDTLSLGLVRKMLSLGVSPDALEKNKQGEWWSPLNAALRHGRTNIFRVLCDEYNANINGIDLPDPVEYPYHVPIYEAVMALRRNGRRDLLGLCLKHDADINRRVAVSKEPGGREFTTPLLQYIQDHTRWDDLPDGIAFLLDNGARLVEDCDPLGGFAPMEVPEVQRLLDTMGVMVLASDSFLKIIRRLLPKKGLRNEQIEHLLARYDYGAPPEGLFNDDMGRSWANFVSLILEHQAEVYPDDNPSFLLLGFLWQKFHTEVMPGKLAQISFNKLWSGGADINKRYFFPGTDFEVTILHSVCECFNKHLHQQGAGWNVQYAERTLEFLIRNGADPNIRSGEGLTPADYLSRHGMDCETWKVMRRLQLHLFVYP